MHPLQLRTPPQSVGPLAAGFPRRPASSLLPRRSRSLSSMSTAAVTCRAPQAVAGALEARDRRQRRRRGRRAAQRQQPRSHRRRQRGRRVAQRGQHRGHRHGGVRPSAQGFPGSPFGQAPPPDIQSVQFLSSNPQLSHQTTDQGQLVVQPTKLKK
ncbi:hypothetical protein PVAP13_5NG564200 [Panicum virgatum]|uniref:Uncharacterized protein n=1 Tax=Panicum virgatum TaxID=38727 RepID=A0A8T0S7Z5_PANVG|nr:hypothetical protein PVAP13_5NG564200 [Panicum virgatum]